MTALVEWASRLERALDPLIAIGSVLLGLVLAGAAVSFLAMARARAAELVAQTRLQAVETQCRSEFDALRACLTDLASQLDELRRNAATVPSVPKPGFNLTKRSQALRLHRHGAGTAEISAELGIPASEVDLLLKVHRIVIRNL